ncbi:MAG: single-stranded-DNA-specific exonuclease RecJ [Flavobacteriaceae bacterium]|nr:single-stranded-DNA-specific exonuclease RecJ [Flavobacteriaceae bacterium]|tara:strand:+ start:2380 stop:4077 length:1698 start_codon:yes stop_codon:yes gene_type:complete
MRWIIKPKPDPKIVGKLSSELGVENTIAYLLAQRGIENFEQAKVFFRPQLTDLHNPYLMKDMDKAVARIKSAISEKQSILIYGDYDVDGTTSVALLANYLESKKVDVGTYIPDRFLEGYGISKKGIDYAYKSGYSLIIALDCGIKALDKVEYAKDIGIDFIICDHHLPGEKLPNAFAILDPKRPDCNYPFKGLCGCGVGFKLVQALGEHFNDSVGDLVDYLDLVATAIGADIVPVIGENRILAYHGLKVLNSNPRPGFEAIIQGLKKDVLSLTDVVFNIAPRINAAGRMKHADFAVTLLKTNKLSKAKSIAEDIENFNIERRSLESEITREALFKITAANDAKKSTTVVYNSEWNKGVIGIVASRLLEVYYRPTIVFTKSDEFLTASARSVKGFNIYNALENCREFIEQFGGHKYAAGLTIKPKNLNAFKNAFENEVKATLNKELKTPEIIIDTIIELDDLNPRFYRILKQFSPFGPQNPTPIFATESVVDTGNGRCVGKDEKHLKITVKKDESKSINAIGFGLGSKHSLVKNQAIFNMAYTLDENVWEGKASLQLSIKDIKIDE